MPILGPPQVIEPPLYLDFQATTPLDARVLDAMLPFMAGWVGNSHATSRHGSVAREAVEVARAHVSDLIGAAPQEIIFTSGATESNNLLIRGAMQTIAEDGRTDLVTTTIEHRSVLDIAERLAQAGKTARYVHVDSAGLVDQSSLVSHVTETTALVSVIAANNEIGVLQAVRPLADIAHAKGALFHSDAAQAAGKVSVDVRRDGIDLMSLSSHKLYGPMGIGAAYIGHEVRRRISPLLYGGGQENGLRSGTLPVPLCVGFGEACRIAGEEREAEAQRLRGYRDLFLSQLNDAGLDFQINGALEQRLPGNLNISFSGVDAEALMMRVRNRVSIASGSACSAESLEPSHVVLALGHGEIRAEEAVRIGFGRTTTEIDVGRAAQVIANAVAGLARVSYGRVAKG